MEDNGCFGYFTFRPFRTYFLLLDVKQIFVLPHGLKNKIIGLANLGNSERLKNENNSHNIYGCYRVLTLGCFVEKTFSAVESFFLWILQNFQELLFLEKHSWYNVSNTPAREFSKHVSWEYMQAITFLESKKVFNDAALNTKITLGFTKYFFPMFQSSFFYSTSREAISRFI